MFISKLWRFRERPRGWSPERGSRLRPRLILLLLDETYAYVLATVALALETHLAGGGGEQRVVRAHADVAAGMELVPR